MASFTGGSQTEGRGQNHDRVPDYVRPGAPSDSSSDDFVEITAVQKMLSATSGSLFTALLATPLDVVRVRWQSQGISQPAAAIDFTKLALPTTSATFRPSNLGVTACCREVFFTNNTSEVCVVGPQLSASSTSPTTTSTSTITCAVEQTQQRTFTSTFDGLRKISRQEGLPALWRGLSPTLVMAVPANIIYFTGYEWLRLNSASPVQRLRLRDEYAPLAAGSSARVLAATAVAPIELFRTRLQAARGSVSDTLSGVRGMVAAHGYRALWRGLTLTLWRDVPFSGMYWWGYETIRGRLTDARERARGRSEELVLEREMLDGRERGRARQRRRSRSRGREGHADTFTDSFIAGAASGGLASVATMPFDVGKTRTQVFREGGASAGSSSSTAAAAAAAPEERNMARLLWHIFRTEGVPGLFRGWIPRTLRVAPSCAVMISSYEVGKRVFRGVNERAQAETKGMLAPHHAPGVHEHDEPEPEP